MNPDFETAFRVLLKAEGGKTRDHAGLTVNGITLRSMKTDMDQDGDVDGADLLLFTSDPRRVREFYKRGFWIGSGCDRIPDHALAQKVFLFAVNAGPGQALKTLHRVLALPAKTVFTPELAKELASKKRTVNLHVDYTAAVKRFYTSLARKKPAYEKFLKGWLARAEL